MNSPTKQPHKGYHHDSVYNRSWMRNHDARKTKHFYDAVAYQRNRVQRKLSAFGKVRVIEGHRNGRPTGNNKITRRELISYCSLYEPWDYYTLDLYMRNEAFTVIERNKESA